VVSTIVAAYVGFFVVMSYHMMDPPHSPSLFRYST
jgi:hypothetical protein